MNKVIPKFLTILTLALLTSASHAQSFTPDETTIAQTQAAIRSGKTTIHQIVQHYLDRINHFDQSTHLNAIILINPQALHDADLEDAAFHRTHKLLPLSGIAVIVKDNYDTANLQTTGGSLALKGWLPSADATMVKKLRDAGAIVLAKSNMAEWAFSPYLTVSSIAGITRNPYDLTRVPAGSSGGTAAAVSANLGEVGLGSDTGNSIRGPSSHNALVGIRPTIGLTSREGIIPLSTRADVGGPMARSVADATAILSVVAGPDPADPVTSQSVGHVEADYTRFLDPNGLKGARIGVFRQYFETPTTDPEIKALMEKAIADLKAQGAIIVDPFTIPDFDNLTKGVGCGNFQEDLDNFLSTHAQSAQYHSLKEIIDSGLYLPSNEAQMKRSLTPRPLAPERNGQCLDTYHDPLKIKFREAFLKAMQAANITAVVYPTWSNAPRKVGDMASPAGDNSQTLSPQTGFPAITVPMGFTHDTLPAGITILGPSFTEGTLIRYAYAYEQATHHRHPPKDFAPWP